jgi:hypothetical protein
VWEDEKAPSIRTWPNNMEAARIAGVGMLIFNGNKETPKSFGAN